ncbi:unnamed protein product [Triticum turgidum subsp. durum]|uniref:Protein kinase domain-containing protein n=1 Tax=Triticum turgidum subsp. durum TaxID=4567 RepID=A0A9R0VEZ6_TRITD|nr:unnamed protein product [Triticum turgidum subsp. durum]
MLLDGNFNAKLADFGLVTQINHTQTSRDTDNIIGTPAYIDPGYVDTGKSSGQSDVYSLGVLLLEIVCGEKPIFQSDGGNSLIKKVRQFHETNTILEAADKRLRGHYDEEIKKVLEAGLRCVHQDRHQRPHMRRLRDFLIDFRVPLRSNPIPSGANESGSAAASEDEPGIMLSPPSRASEDAGVASLLKRVATF